MTTFLIEYNPYLSTTSFSKNGIALNSKSKIGAKSNLRLQVLLGTSINWKGLAEEIAIACDDTIVEIIFKGRQIDYDDLKYAIDKYNGDVNFSLKFEEVKNDEDIIIELDKIFKDIKERSLPQFNVDNSEGKDIFDAYEEVKDGKFEVSVIATMSSGKSTLINALLHTDLLPSENKACTATIARILDNDNMDEFEAATYNSQEELIHQRQLVNSTLLTEYNSHKDVTYIDIEGNIPSIPSNKIKLFLRDTPGPNNSQDEDHGKLTNTIIKRTNSVILYIMNASQIGIKDDEQLLKSISEEMKRSGKQSRDKFIFVINKCDVLDEEKGETIDKLLINVTDYLKKFGIIDPILIPTSARLALLIRKDRKGEKLSRMERKDLNQTDDFVEENKLHYENYAILTPTIREKLNLKVKEYHSDEETWDLEALIHTGIPALEETINEYIEKYAYPMKIKDAIKDIEKILAELDMKSKFEKLIRTDNNTLSNVRKQIQQAKKTHSAGQKLYTEYKEKINAFSLSTLNEKEEKFKIEKELENMSKNYNNKVSIDKVEADNLIYDFQFKLNNYQIACESRLNREIDSVFFSKCSEMLEEYTNVVSDILINLDIDGYDFNKLSTFDKIKISSIDEITQKNSEKRYRKETRWKDNPERAGFWGIFKFWEPLSVSYNVDVEDGTNVNISNVIIDILNVFSLRLKENITTLFNQAEAQISDYKQVFRQNIETLDEEINRILIELEADTAESTILESKVQDNTEIANWVEYQETRIKTLLKF